VGKPPKAGSIAFWRSMFPESRVERRTVTEIKPGVRIG
jgi:hypothetical protein